MPELVATSRVPYAARAVTPEALEDLTTRAGRGERAASEQLLAHLAPRMLGVARKLLGPGHPEVEDAAQEALIEVAKSLPGYRGDGSITSYATRIAVRTTLHHVRRTRARDRRIGDVQPEALDGASASPSGEAMQAERRKLLRDSLATLPPEQAETLAQRVVLGASLEEVARDTGVPVNTVRSRIRLAKEALRRRLVRVSGGEDEL